MVLLSPLRQRARLPLARAYVRLCGAGWPDGSKSQVGDSTCRSAEASESRALRVGPHPGRGAADLTRAGECHHPAL